MEKITKEEFMQNVDDILNNASVGEEAYTIECIHENAVIISEEEWKMLVDGLKILMKA